jgi:hypothetical protein
MTRGQYLASLLPIKSVPKKSRRRKLDEFHVMLARLLGYCLRKEIPIEFGEILRSPEQAARNAATGVGIKTSKHIRALAADINIDPTGKLPIFPPKEGGTPAETVARKQLRAMGVFWEAMGGIWGGNFRTRWDPYHFEHPEKP